MAEILLYTTEGCHLCEQAETLLKTLARLNGLSWHGVEISEQAQLVERYGVRIPVIGIEGIEAELDCPFTEAELISYLERWL